ncbi:MAG: hypothetical protein M3020_10345 [Myxococcota bacterium]|nr:hypothetical protein [Myxococcota bacterium]
MVPSSSWSLARASWLLLALAGASLARPARAAEPHQSRYELETLTEELGKRGAELDPKPEGKTIAGIEFVRLEVFDERDPVPDFVNVFHVTSRERVIRRELLFEEGERWTQSRIDETARNLKGLRQLSLVLIAPLAAREPDQVRVLVITKDIWSLRLNSDFQVADKRLNYLFLSPSEENLFGTHARVAGNFVLQRDTYSVGGYVAHDRLFGSRLSAILSYNQVFNRDTGEREGYYGNFGYGMPLYSVDQRWAFNTGVVVRDYLSRLYGRNGAVARYDAESTAETESIPYVYAFEHHVGATQVTRSFGHDFKLDLSFGVEADRKRYRLYQADRFDARAVSEFETRELPRSDTRISPFLQLESYETRFLKTQELETLGLSEDFRLGHRAIARVYPANRELGSSRDLLGVFTGVSYAAALGDGLVIGLLESEIEVATREQHDARAAAALRIATPRFGFGRLIADGIVQNRYQNYLNRKYAVGGADRLRGYPTDDPDLRGDDAIAANLEFRSAGLNLLSVECGAAAFYDVGGAADGFEQLSLRQSAGIGLRFMFPEFDRIVLRADWGFPLSPGYATFPGALFFTFSQAFPVPGLSAPDVIADAL